MIRTFFICVILSLGSVLFSKDTQDLVLGPIETMIQKVTKISRNPLQACYDEEQRQYDEMIALQVNKQKQKENKLMETEFLQKTLVQIGALLALGFGEAGSEVIAQSMKGACEVNTMIPGLQTVAIFGFCNIRNFSDIVDTLQEEVMLFINEIANIVHSNVHLFSGNANKNVGGAFLLV